MPGPRIMRASFFVAPFARGWPAGKMMMRAKTAFAVGFCLWSAAYISAGQTDGNSTPAPPSALLRLMGEELDYSLGHLSGTSGAKPYFLSYTIVDTRAVSIWGNLGAL